MACFLSGMMRRLAVRGNATKRSSVNVFDCLKLLRHLTLITYGTVMLMLC